MNNTIELIGHYGSDETHACSAWTSTTRDLTPEKRERIPQLLKMLAENGHHTPFEKSCLHFLVRAETASHIHIIKHRIGVSVNGESARYKELKEPTFYTPVDWPPELQKMLVDHCEASEQKYSYILRELEKAGFSRKRAKESARFVLPYANQLELDIMFNWRSFHHFLGLRKKANAQDEIHQIASTMLSLVGGIKGAPFKHTIAAFGYDK